MDFPTPLGHFTPSPRYGKIFVLFSELLCSVDFETHNVLYRRKKSISDIFVCYNVCIGTSFIQISVISILDFSPVVVWGVGGGHNQIFSRFPFLRSWNLQDIAHLSVSVCIWPKDPILFCCYKSLAESHVTS